MILASLPDMLRSMAFLLAAHLVACQGVGQLGGVPAGSDDSRPDDSRPDGPRPDDSRPVPRPDDPRPDDDARPDDSRPDDSDPEPEPDPCGDLDEGGECDGDVARWCEGDRIVEEDCAVTGQACVSDSAGAGCMEPEPEPGTLEGCNHPVIQEELALTNEARRNAGLQELVCDDLLTTAAQLHSDDMCDRGYFSHTSRDGRSHSERMRDAGATFSTSGENIAWGQGSAAEVHRTWMNSWGHRANILGRQYGRIGIGYAPCGGSPLWTQDFAD